MNNNSFEGLYDTVKLEISDVAVNGYLGTNWSLFKNIYRAGSEVASFCYNDGALNYRLIPASGSDGKNIAVVISGDYSDEISVPERFTYTSSDGAQERYYVEGVGYEAFRNSSIKKIFFNSRIDLKNIGDRSFFNCKNLSAIELPTTVKTIGKFAFGYCECLTELTIPNSVSFIGGGAFWNCKGLTEMIIPDSVTFIDYGTFGECWELTKVTIPNSVTYIGSSAFYMCFLGEVTIPNSVTSIGTFAFYGCSGLKNVTIPSSVTSIGDEAFNFCRKLKEVRLDDGQNPIEWGNYVFDNIDYLNTLYIGRPMDCQTFPVDYLTTVTIGNTVPTICDAFLQGARNLDRLTLGSNLKSIGDKAFSGCRNLKEVIVPPSVEAIGDSAFAGNTSLASIIMGHSVNTIGEKAFDACPASTISITAQTPPTAPNNTFSNYSGKLWLQDPGDKSVLNAYYDAFTCWDRFDSYAMVMPEKLEGEAQEIKGKPGDQIQLKVKIWPENVTLKQIFWRSTNPDIATVDKNGLVTIVSEIPEVFTTSDDSADQVRSCKIIAETLYADAPIVEFSVAGETSGIDDVVADRGADDAIDYSAPYEVYNLSGMLIGKSTEGLGTGFYIVRQGRVAKKIAVK